MSRIHMFFNFIRANCKRLLHYLPSMFVSLLLLLLLDLYYYYTILDNLYLLLSC